MNREIQFKAKRLDNGEWVEGYYVCEHKYGTHYIFRNELSCPNGVNDDIRENYGLEMYEVDTDTICQYTGLKDKNGDKIWENDIVLSTDGFAVIKYDNERVRFTVCFEDSEQYEFDNIWSVSLRNIGNIFDNPELLMKC